MLLEGYSVLRGVVRGHTNLKNTLRTEQKRTKVEINNAPQNDIMAEERETANPCVIFYGKDFNEEEF